MIWRYNFGYSIHLSMWCLSITYLKAQASPCVGRRWLWHVAEVSTPSCCTKLLPLACHAWCLTLVYLAGSPTLWPASPLTTTRLELIFQKTGTEDEQDRSDRWLDLHQVREEWTSVRVAVVLGWFLTQKAENLDHISYTYVHTLICIWLFGKKSWIFLEIPMQLPPCTSRRVPSAAAGTPGKEYKIAR